MTEQEFDALYQRWRLPLISYARSIVGSSRADDVVQVAFVQAWVASQGVEIEHPKAWLFEVTRNTAINALKRKANVAGPLSEFMPAPFDLEREVEARDRFRRLLVAITDLPERQKQAILLSSGGTRPNLRAVGEQMGISEGAVKQLIWRARQHILPQVADVS